VFEEQVDARLGSEPWIQKVMGASNSSWLHLQKRLMVADLMRTQATPDVQALARLSHRDDTI
jgi:plasmid maintenance system antidote protein VapI